jgi:enediyne biosynthesis protein E4
MGSLAPIVGRGLAVGDYDNDGRVDVLIVDSEGKPLLLHNETPQAGHWLLLSLSGKPSHGALVTITLPDGKKLLRHCQTDGSYLSASDARVHVGLGSATKASVSIKWPDGKTTEHKDLAADQVHSLKE